MTETEGLLIALMIGTFTGLALRTILKMLGIQIGTKKTRAYISFGFWFVMGTIATAIAVIFRAYSFFLFTAIIGFFVFLDARKIEKIRKAERGDI